MLIMLPVGETEEKKNGVFVGRGQYSLNEEGKNQIISAAETFDGYIFNFIYLSDDKTAKETLDIFLQESSQEKSEINFNEILRERSGGDYEGEKYLKLKKDLSPRDYKIWERDPNKSPPNGESFLDVKNRIKEWFEKEIQPKIKNNETVLLISHPDVIRVIISILRGEPLDNIMRFPIENGLPIISHDVMA